MARILFIQNTGYELLGISHIASYVKPKHTVSVIYGSPKDIAHRYRIFKPDVVGIYALTQDHNWLLRTAALIKSIDSSALVLAGGPHPTFYNDIIRDASIDMICIGEGEKPVLNLLDRLDSSADCSDILSLWVKGEGRIHRNGVDSLLGIEHIPIPDRSIYKEFAHVSDDKSLMVMCSRGCPFSCSFCSAKKLRQICGPGYFRLRRVGDVIEEIRGVREHREVRTIKFQDDVFGFDKKWTERFLVEYKRKIGCKFYCLLRAELVNDDLMDMLEDAGCFRVGIGIESGDEYIRNRVLHKNLSGGAIANAARVMKGRKITVHTFNMLGLPEEDFARALKTLELNIAFKPDVAWSAIFQPYPGTDYFHEGVKHAILSAHFSRFKINYAYNEDAWKIQRSQKLFMLTVRFPVLARFIPLLVRLPLDWLYDKVSELSWHCLYEFKEG